MEKVQFGGLWFVMLIAGFYDCKKGQFVERVKQLTSLYEPLITRLFFLFPLPLLSSAGLGIRGRILPAAPFRLVLPRDEVLPPFPVWVFPPLFTKLIPLRAVISYASDFTHEPKTIIQTDTVSQNDFTFIFVSPLCFIQRRVGHLGQIVNLI